MTELLRPHLRRMLFGRRLRRSALRDLRAMASIDRAHVVMLSERGIVEPASAAALLDAIDRLRAAHFSPLGDSEPSRGLYFLYEDYLLRREGAAVGGVLQTARSRNDLQATALHLRLRRPYARLVRESLRLVAVLIRRARRYEDLMMPLYTHGQVAVPGTLGHYYAAIAQALMRDVDGLLAVRRILQRSPLGAGPIGGTSFPIDTARTAALLGFDRGPLNAIDAVAARDVVLRLLAATSIYSVTLSRLAADVWLWSTAELAFLRFPDDLVGVSSAMPQKRNPYVIEHVIGRSAAALGALTTATLAMHARPFTNSISAGTEATRPMWQALRDASDTTIMLRAMVAGAVPDRMAMEQRADAGFAAATACAERLVREAGFDFRSAHRLVGACVREAIASGLPLSDVLTRQLAARGRPLAFPPVDLRRLAREREFGGGPGPAAFRACDEDVTRAWRKARLILGRLERQWTSSARALDDAVAAVSRTRVPAITPS